MSMENKPTPMQEVLTNALYGRAKNATDAFPRSGAPEYPLIKAMTVLSALEESDEFKVLPQKAPFRADLHIATLALNEQLRTNDDSFRSVYYDETSKWFVMAEKSLRKKVYYPANCQMPKVKPEYL